MDSHRSRVGMLVGLGAAAGAFGVAAMMSAATAPTARADDISDIIAAVEGDYADGQASFSAAYSDFGSNELVPGLTAFIDGVDDDALSAPNNLLGGSLEALTNENITAADPLTLGAPFTFSEALTGAEASFSEGQSFFTEGASLFGIGEYGSASIYDLFGGDLVSIVPLEELLLGAAASF
jgi:hypothetical protein